jgi:hypothetical protein
MITLERAAEITSAVSHPERKRDLCDFWCRYFKLRTKSRREVMFKVMCGIA